MTRKIDTEGYVQTGKNKIKDKNNHWKMLKETKHFLQRKKKQKLYYTHQKLCKQEENWMGFLEGYEKLKLYIYYSYISK